MKLMRLAIAGRLALGALALGAVVGCSGASGTTGFGPEDSGPGLGNPDNGGAHADASSGGSSSGSSGGSGSGSSSGSGGSSGGGGNSSSSSSGGGSDAGGSGSGSGGSSSSSSGAGTDAGGTRDANPDAASHDASGSGSDAGLCADESAWLAPMNAARAAVGEPALVCDPIAAQVALNYASQCNSVHNANRNAEYVALGGAASGVGENIAWGAPTESIATAVQSWLSEQSFYDHATNTCSSTTPGCGHYTQIVWKTTTGVGCAHVSCTNANASLGGATRWDFSVCDYSPPGNIGTQPPY
jgi:hypothetical protein